MKRLAKDIKRREKVDRSWKARIVSKSIMKDRRIVKESIRVERRIRNLKQDGKIKSKVAAYVGTANAGVARRKRTESLRLERANEKKEVIEVARLRGQREGKVTKVRNRCVETGHGRSVIRWFRKSGRKVREMARQGKLEGVFIVSW